MNAISGSTRMAQTRPPSFIKGVANIQAGCETTAAADGQRRLLVKRALFTPTGGPPPYTAEAHLHLSPLLPLPRVDYSDRLTLTR